MFSDPANIVGSRIRAVRTRLGLSQEALAERLHVTRQTVSNWETGRNLPDIEGLKALAEALEVPVEQLIYQEGRSPSRLAGSRWTCGAAGWGSLFWYGGCSPGSAPAAAPELCPTAAWALSLPGGPLCPSGTQP